MNYENMNCEMYDKIILTEKTSLVLRKAFYYKLEISI